MVVIFTETSSVISADVLAVIHPSKQKTHFEQIGSYTGVKFEEIVDKGLYRVNGTWDALVKTRTLIEDLYEKEAFAKIQNKQSGEEVPAPDANAREGQTQLASFDGQTTQPGYNQPEARDTRRDYELNTGKNTNSFSKSNTSFTKTTSSVVITNKIGERDVFIKKEPDVMPFDVDRHVHNTSGTSKVNKYKTVIDEQKQCNKVQNQSNAVVEVGADREDQKSNEKSLTTVILKTKVTNASDFLTNASNEDFADDVTMETDTGHTSDASENMTTLCMTVEDDTNQLISADKELRVILKDIRCDMKADKYTTLKTQSQRKDVKLKDVPSDLKILSEYYDEDDSVYVPENIPSSGSSECSSDESALQEKNTKRTKKKKVEEHKCELCDFKVGSHNSLYKHIHEKHKDSPELKCDMCERTFCFVSRVKKHMQTVHMFQKFECKICKKTYKTKKQYIKHVEKHNNDSTKCDYSCQLCPDFFAEKEDLLKHMSEEHLGFKNLFACKICDKSFSAKSRYNAHVKAHIRNGESWPFGERDDVLKDDSSSVPKSLSDLNIAGPSKTDIAFKNVPVPKVVEENEHIVTSEKKTKTAMKFLKRLTTKSTLLGLTADVDSSGADTEGENEMDKMSKCVDTNFSDIVKTEVKYELNVVDNNDSSIQNDASEITITMKNDEENKTSTCIVNGNETGDNVKPIFSCDFCSYVGLKKKNLRRHIRENHCRNFACEICGKKFGVRRSLAIHMKCTHGKADKFCHICNKAYKLQTTLDKHLLTHKEDFVPVTYACTLCEKSFSGKPALTRHVKVEHLGIRVSYQCPMCDRVMKSKAHYKQHAQVHAGIKRYVCDVCGKAFTYEKSLREHKYMHESVRRFECDVCKKTFKQSTSLRTHMKTHQEQKDYICPICGKGFSQKQALDRHERIHSGEKPFSCSLCSKTFTDSSIIRRHMILLHKRDPKEWRNGVVSKVRHKKDFYIEGLPEHHISKKGLISVSDDQKQRHSADSDIDETTMDYDSVTNEDSNTKHNKNDESEATLTKVKDEPMTGPSGASCSPAAQQDKTPTTGQSLHSSTTGTVHDIDTHSLTTPIVGPAAYVGPGHAQSGHAQPPPTGAGSAAPQQNWESSGYPPYYSYQNYQQFQGPQN